MSRFKSRFCIVALPLAVLFVGINQSASAQEATGAITGIGDPGAQIIVTQVGNGEVIGVVVKCDGSYRVEGLKPADYEIVEKDHIMPSGSSRFRLAMTLTSISPRLKR